MSENSSDIRSPNINKIIYQRRKVNKNRVVDLLIYGTGPPPPPPSDKQRGYYITNITCENLSIRTHATRRARLRNRNNLPQHNREINFRVMYRALYSGCN